MVLFVCFANLYIIYIILCIFMGNFRRSRSWGIDAIWSELRSRIPCAIACAHGFSEATRLTATLAGAVRSGSTGGRVKFDVEELCFQDQARSRFMTRKHIEAPHVKNQPIEAVYNRLFRVLQQNVASTTSLSTCPSRHWSVGTIIFSESMGTLWLGKAAWWRKDLSHADYSYES